MAEESTRKLLKLFGVAVTEFEDESRTMVERLNTLGPPSASHGQILDLVQTWLKANGKVLARWQEVNHLLAETQANGQAALVRVLAQFREAADR